MPGPRWGVLMEFFLHGGLLLLFSQLCVKWLLLIHMASKICLSVYIYMELAFWHQVLGIPLGVWLLQGFQLQGICPMTWGSAPGPRWGLCLHTPVIGSHSMHTVVPGAPNQWPLLQPLQMWQVKFQLNTFKKLQITSSNLHVSDAEQLNGYHWNLYIT